MSPQPDRPTDPDTTSPDDAPATGAADGPLADGPLADVPPVAGGTDDSPPAQGEGEDDSW